MNRPAAYILLPLVLAAGAFLLIRHPRPVPEAETRTRTVALYFYNPEQDQDETGNLLCSQKGLTAVTRDIPFTAIPIQDTVRQLLNGELTEAEKARGITTEFPLPGFTLAAASVNDGVLTLTFDDTNRASNGGSCRAMILWYQIEATAKQFEGIREVRYMPEELFQP